MSDIEKVLQEFDGNVLVIAVLPRELEGDCEHVQAVHGHPARTIGLVKMSATRSLRAAIEHSDVVQPQESALKHVPAVRVLAIDPPGEVDQQLMEDAFQKADVGDTANTLLDLIDAQRGPGME